MSLEAKIEELTQAVMDLTTVMGNGKAAPAEEPEEPEEEEEPAPAKKTRAKKEAAPAKKPARGAAKKGPSAAQVRDKLRELSDTCGREAAKALLTEEFEVAKVTELEEEDYAEFIAACDEAIEDCDADD